jgi:prepilin-type N-terminal cleavage/methylation domain-containing protein
MKRMASTVARRRDQRGFTLVEMSLVLIVIGLILGAVSIGKDMQRNAEYRKVQQKFVDQWVQAYNQIFDRTGVVLRDDPIHPTQVVNFLGITDTATQDELRDHTGPNGPNVTQTNIPEICGVPATNTVLANNLLRVAFVEAGIELPAGRAFNQEDKYLYLDSNGNPQQVSICFQWIVPTGTITNPGPSAGNTMIIRGLTPDLARMLDAAIDGRAEGTRGRFRCVAAAGGSAFGGNIGDSETACEWPTIADNDVAIVGTVTAAYRMNQ